MESTLGWYGGLRSYTSVPTKYSLSVAPAPARVVSTVKRRNRARRSDCANIGLSSTRASSSRIARWSIWISSQSFLQAKLDCIVSHLTTSPLESLFVAGPSLSRLPSSLGRHVLLLPSTQNSPACRLRGRTEVQTPGQLQIIQVT